MIIGILIIIGVFYVQSYFSNHQPTKFNFNRIFIITFNFAIIRPLTNIVSHVVFFGPSILIILFFYKEICRKINEKGGLGVLFLIYIFVFLSITSESREIAVFYTLITFYCAYILQQVITKKQLIVFIILQLIYSKFWYPMNQGYPSQWVIPQKFPAQSFFMNAGPWMSHQMYIINSILLLLVIFILYKFNIFKIQIP
jgi:hypothetical protein